MPLYENTQNAENKIKIDPDYRDSIIFGPAGFLEMVLNLVKEHKEIENTTMLLGFDGWFGVDWEKIDVSTKIEAERRGIKIETLNINQVFRPLREIDKYKKTFITDDPGFGLVNVDGRIQNLMEKGKIKKLTDKIIAAQAAHQSDALIVFGCGSAIKELSDLYDKRFYFDKTGQPLLWQMWDGELIPFAYDKPKKDYNWKEYYYCDYYLLHHQKNFALTKMNYYVEAIQYDDLKLIPRKTYDVIMSTLVQYPVKEVKIYQPGPWGAYRYKHLWDVPGLECNAWNELAGPELSMLVDVGLEKCINMPTMNLMQYADKFVGKYLNENYPELFPLDIWLDDGYFPKPTPAERISMPIHNHPTTNYVKRHFKEPLGRYETYYIAESYEGANTWMGFKEKADLEEWERLCRESEKTGKPIPNWKDFIANYSSNVGDLYLIPPGTTHGHGGNQMVLEMDTCPSIAGTEYSFFTYDFARPSWDDEKKTMTGPKVKMHIEHGFDNEKWCRENWVKENLLAKAKVVKWTKDYWMDRYASLPNMPFHIERFYFKEFAENDTEGKFMHIVTLTVGERIKIRSKSKPELETEVDWFQSAIVPACFGKYEFINLSKGQCTVVQLRWKKG